MKRADSNPTRRGGWRTYRLLLGICYVLLASPAVGQSLVGFGKREEFVGFEAQGANVTSSNKTVAEFNSSQKRFSEEVGVRGDMYVLDRSFVTMNYGMLFGVLQDRLDSNGKESPGRGQLLGFDLGGSLLSDKNYTTNLFTNRTHTFNLHEFAGTTNFLSENQGVLVFLKSFLLPSTLSYRREFAKEDSQFGFQLTRREEQRKVLAYDGQTQVKSHDLALHYDRTGVEDRTAPSLNFTSQSFTVDDRWNFNAERTRTLSSNLYSINRKGVRQLTSSTLTLNEDLMLQHTDSLSSAYHYILSRFTGAGFGTTVQTGSGTLRYHLYKSLTTALTLRGEHAGIGGGSQSAFGGRFDADYRKKLPGSGTLLANLTGVYEIQDQKLRTALIPVFQEKHPAQIGIPFRLVRPQLILASISVSGEDGAILFLEGVDYVVRSVGEFAEIEVRPFGRIREGETLVIDYQVRSSQSLAYSSRSMGWTIGPDYRWVYPYYAFERNLQTLLSGMDTGSLENLTAHTAGVKFRISGRKLNVFLGNEYRTQDSRFLPFASLQFLQAISCPVFGPVSTTIDFEENLYHYKRPERKTGSGTGRLNVQWEPFPAFSIDGFVSVRLWRDTLAISENYQQEGIKAQWSTRRFSLNFTISRDERIRAENQSRQLGWLVSILRKF